DTARDTEVRGAGGSGRGYEIREWLLDRRGAATRCALPRARSPQPVLFEVHAYPRNRTGRVVALCSYLARPRARSWGGTTDVRVPRDHDSPARRVPDGNR